MISVNPATETQIREYPELSDGDLTAALEQSARAFMAWRKTPFAERAKRMHRAAELLRDDQDRLGLLMTEEMGKPITQAEAEVEKCAWVCDFYADNAERFLSPQPVETDASKSFVRFDPLGPVLAIMPWNFPLWQVFRFAAPAIMAGNVGLLKHASNVLGCALAIQELFVSAEFPPDVFRTLLIPTKATAGVIQHPAVRAVTLTGSEQAGQAVAEEAGRNLKKTVLELGGSDPFIVLADADVDGAARLGVKARMLNSGQSCIAAKRFIVEESVADRFIHVFHEQMRQLQVGDPQDRATDVGPLAREDLLGDLHNQVTRSVEAGAKLRLGGERLDMKGYFYAPTLLTDVEPGMPAFDEETFGPVAAVIRAKDREHAIELANQSSYGLGASISTGDPAAAEQLAAQIEAGCVFINEMVKSDPRVPFGGIKRSGYGRELAEFGIREFVNPKTVWIA